MEWNVDVTMLDDVARSARHGKDSIVFDVFAFIGLVVGLIAHLTRERKTALLTCRPELGEEVQS